MKQFKTLFLTASLIAVAGLAQAHHSFAIYELENKTEIKGVLSKVTITNPHIRFYVDVENEDGTITEWNIESMNPTRWRSFDFPEADEIAEIGEEVSILGWKARNGAAEMALGSVITERGETEIRDFIRQGQGNRGEGGMGGMGRGMAGN